MLFFLAKGYRVIAHDRRGHGRSTQVADGHDLDHYADDLAAVTAHLDLKDAIHIGHSTGGGEVVRYLARHGESRVAKAAIISAVPPIMVKTGDNPLGLPKSVFDDLQAQLFANRSKFFYELPAGPFLVPPPAEASLRGSFDSPEKLAQNTCPQTMGVPMNSHLVRKIAGPQVAVASSHNGGSHSPSIRVPACPSAGTSFYEDARTATAGCVAAGCRA